MALADYITSKPVIETNRLIIRKMVSSDIPALREWMPDKSIYTYWGKGPGKADRNPELLFEKEEKPTKSFHLGIAEKNRGKVVGGDIMLDHYFAGITEEKKQFFNETINLMSGFKLLLFPVLHPNHAEETHKRWLELGRKRFIDPYDELMSRVSEMDELIDGSRL